MSNQSIHSIMLNDLLERWRRGDREAADALLNLTGARLEKLTRRMLRAYPNVRECTETGDVYNTSLVRLLNTLKKIDPLPATTRDFFNLAAVHVRRELIDLARHYKNKRWLPLDAPAGEAARDEPAAPVADKMERWEQFHEAVERLPVEEREVVGLVFYHGWKQQEIADLFQVNVKTIQRRWATASEKLRAAIDGDVLGGEKEPAA
jgi:RNA polymerase sigma-70 factor (ECF subfamily)